MLKKRLVGPCYNHRLSALSRAISALVPRPESSVPGPSLASPNTGRPKQSHPLRRRLALWFGLGLLGMVFSGSVLAQPQIVNCDAQVQSRKRGLGVNSLSDADFRALAPGVSWYYNWGATPLAKPADVVMDFLPMAWNGSSSFQTSISSYLAAGNRPWRVFALNEPNLKGQAFMTPTNSAVTFKQVKAICDPYNIPVIAPHMAIGSAVADSITAYDPLHGVKCTPTLSRNLSSTRSFTIVVQRRRPECQPTAMAVTARSPGS